jgi:hypothetical protein
VPDDVDEGQRFVEAVNEASAVDDEETARRRKESVGATFGAFDIKEATLDAGDEHPIRLDHARFARGVNAENAVFEHNVLATRARFETGDGETTGEIGRVSFRSAEFGEGEVSFESAEFGEGPVLFGGTEFGVGNVGFVRAKFGKGQASFNYAKFGEGSVSFDIATFGEGNVLFMNANFEDAKVSFDGTEFGKGMVSFDDAEFGKKRCRSVIWVVGVVRSLGREKCRSVMRNLVTRRFRSIGRSSRRRRFRLTTRQSALPSHFKTRCSILGRPWLSPTQSFVTT